MNEVQRLLSDLVVIDSVNPDLVPGARREGEIARYVADWMRRAGLEVTVEDTGKPGRPNVIGVAHGTGGGRSSVTAESGSPPAAALPATSSLLSPLPASPSPAEAGHSPPPLS